MCEFHAGLRGYPCVRILLISISLRVRTNKPAQRSTILLDVHPAVSFPRPFRSLLLSCPQRRPTAASGLISLLEEEDNELRTHALKRLHQVVDQHWAEVAAVVPLIEELSEDDAFPARELAAAVASKCFFHLEEYSDALRLALGAGEYFDVSSKTEYVSTMVSKCIDQYTAQRTATVGGIAADESTSEEMDPRMEGIVERMFERCYADGEFTQAMGIALEAHRLDKVEETIQQATDKPALLKYTFGVCQTLVTSRQTRLKVLAILVAMHRLVPEPDHVAVCKCLQFLGEVSVNGGRGCGLVGP